MHVLIIPSEEFLPPSNPMVGIFQYHQAKILKQGGYQVGVLSITQSFSVPMLLKGIAKKISFQKSGNTTDAYSFGQLFKLGYNKMFQPEHFLTVDNSLGMPVFRIDGFYYKPPVANYNYYGWVKAGMSAFEQYIKVYGKPEVIHAHNAIYAGMLAKKLKEKFQIPFVLTEHSTAFARKEITDKKLLEKIKGVYEKGAVVTAVSEPFCNLLNKTFGFKKFQILHNVLDQELEQKTWNLTTKKDKPFTFINIAELHPKKDHVTLIKAFKQVYIRNKNVQLLIGGEGELSNELRAFVVREGLQQSVHFLGALNRREVSAYLMDADCFVLSSKYETFGVVVIEAMLFGKPVIVTNCGGPESFVTPSLGIVIEKENMEKMADAMSLIIKNINNYRSDAIRKLCIDQFGHENFLQNVGTYYKQAMGLDTRSINKNQKINEGQKVYS